jgi:glycosyltransferase involved in cell wall biosynthesis
MDGNEFIDDRLSDKRNTEVPHIFDKLIDSGYHIRKRKDFFSEKACARACILFHEQSESLPLRPNEMQMLSAKHRLLLHKIRVYGGERLSLALDMPLYLLRIPAMRKTKTSNTVVFVGENLSPRIARMAKRIRRESDYQCVLVCHRRGFYTAFSNGDFHGIYTFRNQWHMKRILRSIADVRIVHGFAPKSRFPDEARRFLQKPYIQDMQDVYSIYYEGNQLARWLKEELPYERECLSRADGIVAHSIEPNQALRMLRPERRPKTLFFPLYCDDDSFQQVSSTPKHPGELHIVYAGGVAGSHRDSSHYGNTQFHGLIDRLGAQRIHFHIYPSPTNVRADWEEYEQLDKTNPWFHFHSPVPQENLAAELSRYDFGILPFFKELSDLSDMKLKYATSLKLFNYLEAGLPVIVSEDIVYQHWMATRYGAGITLKSEGIDYLRETLERQRYEELSRAVEQARTKLSLKANIPRLLDFYTTLRQMEVRRS